MAISRGPWKKRQVGGKAMDIVDADERWIATMANRPEAQDDADVIVSAPFLKPLLGVVVDLALDLCDALERASSSPEDAALIERARRTLKPPG